MALILMENGGISIRINNTHFQNHIVGSISLTKQRIHNVAHQITQNMSKREIYEKSLKRNASLGQVIICLEYKSCFDGIINSITNRGVGVIKNNSYKEHVFVKWRNVHEIKCNHDFVNKFGIDECRICGKIL